MNVLIELIDKIHKENWCFQFNGACSTCGMQDVHNEIRKYDGHVIIESFEKLYVNDFNKFVEYLTPLRAIYSLITYNYAPLWFTSFNFKRYEKDILEKYSDGNNYVWKHLFSSNAVTYWAAWQKRMDEYEWKTKKGLNDQQLAKKAKLKQKQIDHKQRQEKYRKLRQSTINELEEMTLEERLLYIISDDKHPIQFYPASLVSDILLDIGNYKHEHLRSLYDKICKSGKIDNPQWREIKNALSVKY